jgi:hypothetical protein
MFFSVSSSSTRSVIRFEFVVCRDDIELNGLLIGISLIGVEFPAFKISTKDLGASIGVSGV